MCFESLNFSHITSSRTISGRIFSDELRKGLWSPPLLEGEQASTVKSVLLCRGKTFNSFSGSVTVMCYLYYTVSFEFHFDFSPFLKTGVQQKHRGSRN